MKNGCIISKILLKKKPDLVLSINEISWWQETPLPKESKRDQNTKHTRQQETRTSNQYPGALQRKLSAMGTRRGALSSCRGLSLITNSNINIEGTKILPNWKQKINSVTFCIQWQIVGKF